MFIGDALFTKSQQKVLGLLYGRPDKSFYTNEIVRWANMGKGTICRELTRFVASGVLTILPVGNQRHYQANTECSLYPELCSLVRKMYGIRVRALRRTSENAPNN